MWSRRCDTAEMWEMRFWRVGIARNAEFSIVLWFAGSESQLLKTGGGGSAAQDVDKICTAPARESDSEVKIVQNLLTSVQHPGVQDILLLHQVVLVLLILMEPRSAFGSWSRQNLHHACARAIWKSKLLKNGSLGVFFEVEVAKIWTTPTRESDLEVKSGKTWGSLGVQLPFRVAGVGISTQHPYKTC